MFSNKRTQQQSHFSFGPVSKALQPPIRPVSHIWRPSSSLGHDPSSKLPNTSSTFSVTPSYDQNQSNNSAVFQYPTQARAYATPSSYMNPVFNQQHQQQHLQQHQQQHQHQHQQQQQQLANQTASYYSPPQSFHYQSSAAPHSHQPSYYQQQNVTTSPNYATSPSYMQTATSPTISAHNVASGVSATLTSSPAPPPAPPLPVSFESVNNYRMNKIAEQPAAFNRPTVLSKIILKYLKKKKQTKKPN